MTCPPTLRQPPLLQQLCLRRHGCSEFPCQQVCQLLGYCVSLIMWLLFLIGDLYVNGMWEGLSLKNGHQKDMRLTEIRLCSNYRHHHSTFNWEGQCDHLRDRKVFTLTSLKACILWNSDYNTISENHCDSSQLPINPTAKIRCVLTSIVWRPTLPKPCTMKVLPLIPGVKPNFDTRFCNKK
jgi:hypothetical protein